MRPFAANSVRRRLALWNVCVLALVLVMLGVAFRSVTRITLTHSLDTEMETRATRTVAIWERLTDGQRAAVLTAVRLRRLGLLGGDAGDRLPVAGEGLLGLFDGPEEPDVPTYAVKILDREGRSVISGQSCAPHDAVTFARSLRGVPDFSTVRIDGAPVRVYSLPVQHNGDVVAVIQLARSLAGVQRTVRMLTRTLLLFIPAALLVAGLGGAFLTDRAMRPIRDLRQAAQKIEARRLSQRLPVTGDDEFAALSATFNQMLARLEAAFTQQERFTADASHELRTPLTVILGNATLALAKERPADEYRETIARIARVAETMGATIDDLMTLARADAGALQIDPSPVSLCDVLNAAREISGKPGAAPISVSCDSALAAPGSSASLTRLFTNLLTNAVRHTPPEGAITVTARQADSTIEVSVRDNGAGIAPEHLPHLGDRFYRPDTARAAQTGGAGLGLAISRAIAEAHGGSLAIESALGAGATVRVTLPASISHA
ncbi:two-component sensor histidine kinase [Capsulimonas corticalis]|uniref:histidine kinase n=1 Tax=Capsulimonas corticalis TaxID=2219043 RepID=A0A402D268_9BACT|nr:ATP-binding protein [Capsulimonas corticalis]BDI30130.1 two-component sensor histidine kinase [Capsulimonas corticalis]